MTNESDPLDQASELTQQLTEGYINAVRLRSRPEQVQGAGGVWPILLCVECEDTIVLGRLAMGKIRCVGCQEVVDKSRRFNR